MSASMPARTPPKQSARPGNGRLRLARQATIAKTTIPLDTPDMWEGRCGSGFDRMDLSRPRSPRIPLILRFSSPPCWLNRLGLMAAQLVVARPGKFDGVELVGGSHIDAVQRGNTLVQLGAYLVGGFSQPQTIDAVRTLASG